jgi:polyhydroxyalkanoate synthase subunit PhaC
MKNKRAEDSLEIFPVMLAGKAEAARVSPGFLRVERDWAARELVWQQGKVKLFRYHRRTPAQVRTPVLLVYGYIDRQCLQDIEPSRAFIRHLLQQGLDVYSIGWGHPSRADRFFSLNDYLNEYLDEAIGFLCQ